MGELFDGCRRYITLIANHVLNPALRPKVGASDLVQETFLEAQRDFGKFRGHTRGELFAWLTRILKNRSLKSARRYRGTDKRDIRRERNVDLNRSHRIDAAACDMQTPSGVLMAADEERMLTEALSRLSPDHRQVIELRNWHRQSFAEVGTAMGRSTEAARKLWSRAVEQLAEQLPGES